MPIFGRDRSAATASLALLDEDHSPRTGAGGPGSDYLRGVNGTPGSHAPGSTSGPQRQLMQLSRTSGLARFAISIVADTGSRVKLFPERFNLRNGEWEQFDDPLSNMILQRYRGRTTDSQQTLWYHLWHRRSAGERYQVYEVDEATGEAFFSVYSISAVTIEGGNYKIVDRQGGPSRLVPAQQVVRMWWPDPDWPQQAWSAMFAGLEDLQRYQLLGRLISRTAASSLLARGIMWTPREGQGRKVADGLTQLQADYYAAAKDRLNADDTSVAATVPYMVHYGNDFQAPKLITFDLPFDGHILSMRSEALESFARAADLPSALVLNGGPGAGQTGAGGGGGGAGRSNHISDLLVDRRYFDHTVAPQVEAVLWEDLTRWFLRPALRVAKERGQFSEDPALIRIGYDPSPVIVPADRSRTALDAFRTGLLSIPAALKALGFSSEDAPSPAELEKIIQMMIAMNQGIRQGDQNQRPGNPERGVADAGGAGTAVATT